MTIFHAKTWLAPARYGRLEMAVGTVDHTKPRTKLVRIETNR